MIETAIHSTLAAVTERIVRRSAPTRRAYLDLIARQRERGLDRPVMSCANPAHGFTAAGEDKAAGRLANCGMVTWFPNREPRRCWRRPDFKKGGL
jgi:phosphogluconate dehydratase